MKKLYAIFISLIVQALITLYFLTYGNPQSSKYIFMWQCYVYPAKYDVPKPENNLWRNPATGKYERLSMSFWVPTINGYIKSEEPSDNYTGNWKAWHKNGNLAFEAEHVDGPRHGLMRDYYEDGSLRSRNTYVKNKIRGWSLMYLNSGVLTSACYHDHHPKWGETFYCIYHDEDGTLYEIAYSASSGLLSHPIYSRANDLREENKDMIEKHEKSLNEFLKRIEEE